MYYNLLITFVTLFLTLSCTSNVGSGVATAQAVESVIPGAWRTEQYLPILDGKRVSLVVNHTSLIGQNHLVDSLLSRGVSIERIFAPEHGFRGEADAGEHVSDEKDAQTGLPIISLYGSKRGPSSEDLATTDLVVFDIQDVGARFYTYISTMHYVMSACASEEIPILVLDRPNPNGHYVDGPIREASLQSFVGMHPVPIVYGMTIGEYAAMINGEGWLENGRKCELQVIPIENYTHQTVYELPVPPSPNLPNLRSILLYPSLCFFEGTPLSIGRGTTTQFQVIGHPDLPESDFSFVPTSSFGAANPKLKDQLCHGESLVNREVEEIFQEGRINMSYLLKYFRIYPDKSSYFNENNWIDKLAGTTTFRQLIMQGKSEDEIRQSWAEDLTNFEKIRSKYLAYE